MIKSLEGGRGLAALIVALYHLKFGMAHFAFIRNGYLFVDLFFVLSGFVIAASYSTRLHTLRDFGAFMLRRFGRLFPLLVFSTVAYVLSADLIVLVKRFAVTFGHAGELARPDALSMLVPSGAEILATLTMTHGMGVFDHLILNTPSWSISVELYTYIVFAAICLWLGGRRRFFAVIAVGAAAFLVTVWASVALHDCGRQGGCLSVTYDFGFTRCLLSFFLGVLTYYVKRRIAIGVLHLQLIGTIVLVALFALVDAAPLLAFLFPFAFGILVLSVSDDRGPLAKLLTLPFLQMLGQRSYSIYLMHVPLLMLFEPVAKRAIGMTASGLVLFAYVAALIAISGWTYRFVEDPFRLRFNRMAAGIGVAARPVF